MVKIFEWTVTLILFIHYVQISNSFGFSRRFAANEMVVSLRKNGSLKNTLKHIALATVTIGLAQQSIALEDLGPEDSNPTVKYENLDETEAIRVQKKFALQEKSRSKSGPSVAQGDYKESLKREIVKQEERKKSKTARSQDLCEVLGRGC